MIIRWRWKRIEIKYEEEHEEEHPLAWWEFYADVSEHAVWAYEISNSSYNYSKFGKNFGLYSL